MGDVCEGTGMDENGSSFQGLHQVWLNGILHEHCEGTSNTDIVGSDWVTTLAGSDDHRTKTLTHVSKTCSKCKNGHTFTGYSDIKPSDTFLALFSCCLTNCDLAKETIISIQNTVPGDRLWINVKTSKTSDLFWSQVIRVCLVNP